MDTHEKEIYNAILIAVGALTAIGIYFFVALLRQQKRFRSLSQAKIKAEITTLENERSRIAADLHDEVGPLLSAIKLQINNIDGSDAAESALIKKTSLHIDDVIKKMREISNDLLPNVLIRRGLVPAVADFITKIGPATPTKITLEHNSPARFLATVEVNAYRIVQEVVHNAIKHAQAKTLRIHIKMEPHRLQITTQDDGVGFDHNRIGDTKSGLGLLNLQSRTDVMNGEFDFESFPGKGTKYAFDIPLNTST
ncbi:MAG: sensor histidine kinase [Bacteroidetes bacterium]|nr:MAG: sensor histidine kinase [Bacteroidota bacterium]